MAGMPAADAPAPQSLSLPGSKSITARALFLAAAADGVTTLVRPLRSDDTEGFAEGLVRLGYRVGRTPDAWQVDGRPQGPAVAEADVYCRDGATTARFLPTLAAAGHGTYRFDASPQMRRRPLLPLTRALRDLGVDLRHEEAEGHHPLTVAGGGRRGRRRSTLDAGQSSQYLTALLLLGPLTRPGLQDHGDGPGLGAVRGDHDRDDAGVRGGGARGRGRVRGPAGRLPRHDLRDRARRVHGELLLRGGGGHRAREVTVPGLGTGALQGDLGFVDVLRRMGARGVVGAEATTVAGTGELRGLTVNMRDISDTMPTLAALAPFASAPVRIEDVANTRVKECDRLEACAENLRRLGVRVATGPDWIEIHPGPCRPPRSRRTATTASSCPSRYRSAGAGNLVRRPRLRTEDFPRFPRGVRGAARRAS